MDNIGRPSKDHLLATGRLDKVHDGLECGGITETTMTSVEVWQCGRPTNQWRLYRDQHGVDRVIPEPNPTIKEWPQDD
jgi:hypothetical protein